MRGSTYSKVSGPFGSIQLAAHDQSLVCDIATRSFDVAGCVHVDRAHLQLSIEDAYRFHAALASMIAAAEQTDDVRQTRLWSDATHSLPIGWRV